MLKIQKNYNNSQKHSFCYKIKSVFVDNHTFLVYLLTFKEWWEHLVCDFSQHFVGLLIHLRLVVVNFAVRIYDEHFWKRHSNVHITHRISISVSKAAIEGRLIIWKQFYDVLEARNLEHLGFSEDNFSAKGVHQTIWAHKNGPRG